MPSMTCKCGQKISFGQIPCPDEWLLVSDVQFNDFGGNVDSEELYRAFHSMFRCPQCDRLWVYWDGLAGVPKEYRPAE